MKFLYILAGILSFLATLLFTLPPEKALAWWGDELEVEVSLYAPQGGLASGSASAVSIDNFRMDATRWKFYPLSLLKGRLGFQINSEIAGSPAQALAEFGMSGRVVIHDLQAGVPLTSVLPLLQGSGLVLPIGGMAQADIQILDIQGERPTELEGLLKLQRAELSFLRPPMQLGSYQAVLSTEDDLITAEISEAEESPITATGKLTLNSEGRYQLDLRLKPKPAVEQRLLNQLKLLGRPDAQGWYRLQSQGHL